MQLVADLDQERLDVFLARQLPEYSRSFWQGFCQDDKVTVNKAPARSSLKLKTGDKIGLELPGKPDFTGRTLPIIYQDDDVVVINKPAGLLSHAKGTLSEEFSVAEFMRPQTSDGTGGNRPGIVHRLDRGTSGVMIAAKNEAAKQWLQKQFSQRRVKKAYLALVKGVVEPAAAIIRLPIERNPKKPQTFRVGSNGRPAETHYQTLANYSGATLLKLEPTTGRTHQLRVHLAHLNHPIIGDFVYGTADKKLGRPFLHAAELELTLPSKQRQRFEAPLPADLQTYLESLKQLS